MRKALYEMTDDIGRYLYMCLEHRHCAVCGKDAVVHHVDCVGMGNNRDDICHVGMHAIALCAVHHDAAHHDEIGLFKAHHVYGIKLDEYLVRILKLGVITHE